MKSSNIKEEAPLAKPDLYARSYSPLLRVLIVGALFLVAIFVLVACGSSKKPSAVGNTSAQTATTSTVAPSSTPAAAQAGLTCSADKSADSIDAGKYFGGILTQVRSQWKKDAVISSVRFDRQFAANFQDLCSLKTNSDWKLVFYSLSGKNEVSGNLDNSKTDSSGVPPVVFTVDKLDNSASTSLTYADMKKQGGWKFHEYSRPETFALESKYAANPVLGWKLSMRAVVQKLIDRVKDEKMSPTGFNVSIGKASLKTKSPYVSIYWQKASKGKNFFVEPITLKSYDQTY